MFSIGCHYSGEIIVPQAASAASTFASSTKHLGGVTSSPDQSPDSAISLRFLEPARNESIKCCACGSVVMDEAIDIGIFLNTPTGCFHWECVPDSVISLLKSKKNLKGYNHLPPTAKFTVHKTITRGSSEIYTAFNHSFKQEIVKQETDQDTPNEEAVISSDDAASILASIPLNYNINQTRVQAWLPTRTPPSLPTSDPALNDFISNISPTQNTLVSDGPICRSALIKQRQLQKQQVLAQIGRPRHSSSSSFLRRSSTGSLLSDMTTILDRNESLVATPRLSDSSMSLSRRDRRRGSSSSVVVVRDEDETETESEGDGDGIEEAEYQAKPILKRKLPPPTPHPNPLPLPMAQPAREDWEPLERARKRQRSSTEGGRPKYHCLECPATYGRHKELLRHMSDAHNTEKRAPTDPKLTCKQCGILCSRTDALARHVKNKRCR
ncbi:UNVERIFIED_CONTAM: hypothetical protein HDU68_012519 [Siphonaria sp. JEL0065]|nr:hypothetical protein HDU68_012519 [Siphonaria sp. JEL0065]